MVCQNEIAKKALKTAFTLNDPLKCVPGQNVGVDLADILPSDFGTWTIFVNGTVDSKRLCSNVKGGRKRIRSGRKRRRRIACEDEKGGEFQAG